MSLDQNSVVVTGAGSGIGRAVAVHALRDGARVTVVGRREEPLRRLADEFGGSVNVVAEDLCRPGAAEMIIKEAVRHGGGLDGVVNNAGAARFAPLENAEMADLDAMLEVNVKGPAAIIKYACPHLEVAGGSVVNVTSVAGALSMPGRSFYGASKAAINSLTRSLALELAPRIRVNAVLPGPVDTPLWRDTGMTGTELENLRANLEVSTPIGRFGEPEEVARWVCLLLDRDTSGWVTGVLIPVDGGRTL